MMILNFEELKNKIENGEIKEWENVLSHKKKGLNKINARFALISYQILEYKDDYIFFVFYNNMNVLENEVTRGKYLRKFNKSQNKYWQLKTKML